MNSIARIMQRSIACRKVQKLVGRPLISPLYQPLHHPPQLGRRVARQHLDIANPRPPQRFLLDRVARGDGVGRP